MPEGWATLTYPESGFVLRLDWPTEKVPYFAVLVDECGWQDLYSIFVEPATASGDRLDIAKVRGKCSTIRASSSLQVAPGPAANRPAIAAGVGHASRTLRARLQARSASSQGNLDPTDDVGRLVAEGHDVPHQYLHPALVPGSGTQPLPQPASDCLLVDRPAGDICGIDLPGVDVATLSSRSAMRSLFDQGETVTLRKPGDWFDDIENTCRAAHSSRRCSARSAPGSAVGRRTRIPQRKPAKLPPSPGSRRTPAHVAHVRTVWPSKSTAGNSSDQP